MSDETEKKPEEEKKMEEKPEDKEKTSDEKDSKEESNKAIVDGFTKIAEVLSKNTEVLSKIDERLTKALEEPTDLPLKPKGSQGGDDVGDKTKVPDTYQSNSQQASIDDSDPKNESEKDPSDLKMQEKTEVKKSTQLEKITAPRPTTTNTSPNQSSGGLTSIEKAYAGTDKSPILDDMREVGIEGKNIVAQKILKGHYYMPTDQEVGRF